MNYQERDQQLGKNIVGKTNSERLLKWATRVYRLTKTTAKLSAIALPLFITGALAMGAKGAWDKLMGKDKQKIINVVKNGHFESYEEPRKKLDIKIPKSMDELRYELSRKGPTARKKYLEQLNQYGILDQLKSEAIHYTEPSTVSQNILVEPQKTGLTPAVLQRTIPQAISRAESVAQQAVSGSNYARSQAMEQVARRDAARVSQMSSSEPKFMAIAQKHNISGVNDPRVLAQLLNLKAEQYQKRMAQLGRPTPQILAQQQEELAMQMG